MAQAVTCSTDFSTVTLSSVSFPCRSYRVLLHIAHVPLLYPIWEHLRKIAVQRGTRSGGTKSARWRPFNPGNGDVVQGRVELCSPDTPIGVSLRFGIFTLGHGASPEEADGCSTDVVSSSDT